MPNRVRMPWGSRRLAATLARVGPSCVLGLATVSWLGASVYAQQRQQVAPSLVRNHPAIAYATSPQSDPVFRLNERLRNGEVTFASEPVTGYLRSVLKALNVPVESQVLVFSKTSFQAKRISPQNPRAIYFGDNVAVGFVRGGDVLEFISQDPKLGSVFYQLHQNQAGIPQFERTDASCVYCHVSDTTQNVPGPFIGSVFPGPDGTANYGPVYMGNDGGRIAVHGAARFGDRFVTAGVVAIEFGVDDPADLFVRERLDRRDHFVAELPVPRVDDHHAVVANLHRDVRSRANDHVHVALHVNRPDISRGAGLVRPVGTSRLAWRT